MDEHELEQLLQSPDSREVLNAIGFIAGRRSMLDLSTTIALMRHTDPIVKRAAVNATVSIIRSSLIENYHQLSREGRSKLVEIIDRIHPETISELIRDVHSSNEDVRVRSLMILGLLRRREQIRHLIEKELKSSNVKVRATAVQAMGNHPDSSEHLLLLKQLNDSDSRVRANAIEALEQFGDPKLEFSLKRLLNDGNSRVRANALKALYRLGNEDIENDIIVMLNDRSTSMVASGLWLVAELGLSSPELQKMCEMYRTNPDPVISRNCERALRNFPHPHD